MNQTRTLITSPLLDMIEGQAQKAPGSAHILQHPPLEIRSKKTYLLNQIEGKNMAIEVSDAVPDKVAGSR